MYRLAEFQQQLRSGALRGARRLRLADGLTEFPEEIFELADSLEWLDLGDNQLTELPADLPRLHRLRILFASNNPFTRLPEVLGRCAQLEMVGFKACQIEQVPAQSLPPQLRWLILTGNRIHRLPESLGQRPRLQKLMLSCNRLQTLPDSLRDCAQLELLRIASNDFHQLPEVVEHLPRLAWLALAGNPLTLEREQQLLHSCTRAPLEYAELTLGELLGQGASGEIFAAHSPRHPPLALKIFKADQTSDGTPASELAAGLAAGGHPQLLSPVASVIGHPDGRLAMALPRLPANLQPLAGPPDFASCTRDIYPAGLCIARPAALRLLQDIASALRHLHAQGLLHGDFYAHNILWDRLTGQAVLSDLGAAALLPPDLQPQLLAMEQRALGIWIAEVLERSQGLAGAESAALRQLAGSQPTAQALLDLCRSLEPR